jgi:hypothetical protein
MQTDGWVVSLKPLGVGEWKPDAALPLAGVNSFAEMPDGVDDSDYGDVTGHARPVPRLPAAATRRPAANYGFGLSPVDAEADVVALRALLPCLRSRQTSLRAHAAILFRCRRRFKYLRSRLFVRHTTVGSGNNFPAAQITSVLLKRRRG